ncbi:F-box/FBD/LRR-repeat protein-like protein [Tanacetum coccineum]
MDRISNLPLSLLETILCLLPYHEVVRTSTLSKEWRYHWTDVTKIVVIEDTRTLNRIKLLSGVSQALLMHKGPIHEVTLSVSKDDHWGFDTAIRRIISHLSSKKAVKKLTVDSGSRVYHNSLPISLFLMSQLTDLYLNGCKFRHNPRFSELKRRRKGPTSWAPKKKKKQNKITSSGFGNLTSLYLINSKISIKTLLHLLSTCPLLNTVTLITHNFYDYNGVTYTNLFESLMLIESLTICPEIIEDPSFFSATLIPRKCLCSPLKKGCRQGVWQ